jgi:hypothetical protein
MSFNNDPQQPGWAAPPPPPDWQPGPPPSNWQPTPPPPYTPPGYPPTPQPGYPQVPPPPGYMPPGYYPQTPPPGYGMPSYMPPPRKSRLPKIIGSLVLIIVLVFGSLLVIGYVAVKQDEGRTYFSLTAPGDQCDLPNHISTATTSDTVYFVANMKDTLASSEEVTLIEKFAGAQVSSGVVPGDSSGQDFSCVTYNHGLSFESPGTYTIELDHNGKLEATGDITITAGAGGGGAPVPSSLP